MRLFLLACARTRDLDDDKITKNVRIFVNFRDFPEAMATAPERLLYVVVFSPRYLQNTDPLVLCLN